MKSLTVFALFTGRSETLLARKCNLLHEKRHLFREVFIRLAKFIIRLPEFLILRSGDRHGVLIHGVFSLAFAMEIIPYFHMLSKEKH